MLCTLDDPAPQVVCFVSAYSFSAVFGSVTITTEVVLIRVLTTIQLDTKSNPNPDPNPNPATKQHTVVNIELNIFTCATYPDKFIRDNVVARLLPNCIRHTAVNIMQLMI